MAYASSKVSTLLKCMRVLKKPWVLSIHLVHHLGIGRSPNLETREAEEQEENKTIMNY